MLKTLKTDDKEGLGCKKINFVGNLNEEGKKSEKDMGVRVTRERKGYRNVAAEYQRERIGDF